MKELDRKFLNLVGEVKALSEKELYYRIRRSFDGVPRETQISCMNFFDQYGYWGKLDVAGGVYEQIEQKAKALFEHMEDFAWLYDRLADYRSKLTLYAVLNNWYCYDFTTTAQAREYAFDDYFDLDLVRCSSGEVMVDLGAYVGDTVLSYILNYGEDCYKKIYCYEITPETFETLRKNLEGCRDIELRQKGVGDMRGRLKLSNNAASSSANTLGAQSGTEVDVVTLDEDIEEPVTLIKADIEGFEQRAILGAKNHIVNDHPKLLISVYHNNEDLWKIPRMIDSMAGDYTFYLRYKGSTIYPTEITLIAL